MLYSIQHTVYYSVAPIRSCTIYCRAHNILYYAYTMLYTIIVQYNVQQFEHHATHCTLFCSTYKLYIHVILCSMQHSVQHTLYCTTHCRIQCTKYKMLNIMQTLYTIMQHIQHPVQDIGEHLTCCMHNVCKIMYNILYNTMHKIQHT